MSSYCLNYKKNAENINRTISKTSNVKQCYYQNVLYVVVKTQDLLTNQKHVDYKVNYINTIK